MVKLVEIDSSDEESNEIPTANEKSNETPAADGGLYETSTADGAVNETNGVDQGEGADAEKAAEGDKGDGLLSGLMDQAKYISQSLDDTLTTLMKLKGNMQDASAQIKQNQETSMKTVENLKKITSDLSSFDSLIGDLKRAAEKKGEGRAYSVNKMASEGTKIQVEEQAKEEEPVETPV